MRFKKYIAQITEKLREHIGAVDSLEEIYKSEEQTIKDKAKEMEGTYLPKYIEEYKKQRPHITDYAGKLKEAIETNAPIVLHYIDLIKRELDSFFASPVRTEFANKITTIKLSGLELSNREFRLLQEQAQGYTELRLLNQLATTRTRKEDAVAIDGDGEPKRVKVQKEDPFFGIALPDIDEVYNAFEHYAMNARRVVTQYCGQNAKLLQFLDNKYSEIAVSLPEAMTANVYFKNGADAKFLEVMEKATASMPEAKVKRELTVNDKKVIDLLIDENYPSLAIAKAKQIAEAMPEIRELLLLDERYAKYIEAEE